MIERMIAFFEQQKRICKGSFAMLVIVILFAMTSCSGSNQNQIPENSRQDEIGNISTENISNEANSDEVVDPVWSEYDVNNQ